MVTKQINGWVFEETCPIERDQIANEMDCSDAWQGRDSLLLWCLTRSGQSRNLFGILGKVSDLNTLYEFQLLAFTLRSLVCLNHG